MLHSLLPSAEDYPLPSPPGWLQGAIVAACLLSILLPAGTIRLSFGGIIFGFFFYMLFWTGEKTLDVYLIGSTFGTIMYRWLDLVAIHQPERDFWRVNEVSRGKENGDFALEGKAPIGAWPKLKWWADFFISLRCIGWNIRVKNLPASVPVDYPKSRWLLESARRLVFMYLGNDISSTILELVCTDAPFFDQPLTLQILIAWTKAFRSYYSVELNYYAAAIPCVLIGYGSPSSWPPITGSFRRDAYTVRKMWGTCWHQLMRRPCSEAGRIVTTIFGFKKGSFASRYSQIWVAFAVSAASHHCGAKLGCFEDGGFWQAVYFLSQPVAIMGEDLVMWVGRKVRIGENVWTKRVGFVWVILWFSWTLRAMVAYQPYSWVHSNSLPGVTGPLIEWVKRSGKDVSGKWISNLVNLGETRAATTRYLS